MFWLKKEHILRKTEFSFNCFNYVCVRTSFIVSILLLLKKDGETTFQRTRQRQGCEEKQALRLYTVGRRRRRRYYCLLFFQ